MSNEVQEFLRRFQAEIRDRALGGGDEAPDFTVNAFTEIIELLSTEVGIIDEAEAIYFEGEVHRGKARVNWLCACGGQRGTGDHRPLRQC